MLDTMFATETMAELSARQGRVADAVAIYRHLLGDAEDNQLTDKWKRRLAELQAAPKDPTSPTSAAAPSPPSAAPPAGGSSEPVEAAAPRVSLVIREPVRSGQVIYAEGCDLVVVAPVHAGAQLLADGHIHIYGPLKGRAVAGAHGFREAEVFCLSLEAELVGVDTGYLLSEDLPAGLWSSPARIFLTPEGTCAVAALPVGKGPAPEASNRARRLFGDRGTAR